MASVTQRVAVIKQPYGGYLPLKNFKKENVNDGNTLNENENISAALVGLAVDYLTRFALGDSVDKAFHISCLGAFNMGMLSKANSLKTKITGLDDISIISACKLVGFDVCCRSSKAAYKPIENILPDSKTIENIRIMVNRSVDFLNKYGPIVCSEPTFEGGYTDTVNAGDGDFITADTLWDFKVSKNAPTTKHSLQILMYYIMGLHSIYGYYKNITNLGFFNPRLNIAYICPVSSIPIATIIEIEKNVICYGVSLSDKNKVKTIKPKNIQTTEYSVEDICKKSGIKKNKIYADIRSGRLAAHKKGNKYFVSKSSCDKYIKTKKREQKILACIYIGISIICLIIIIYMFIEIFPFL